MILYALFKPFIKSEFICKPSSQNASLEISPPSKTGIISNPNFVANSSKNYHKHTQK